MQCRACLKPNCETATLLDEYKIKCFNLITALKIHMEDSLPQQLCENCAKDLDFCVEFREKCINSNSILVNAWRELDTEKDNKVDLKIKSEYNNLKDGNIQHVENNFVIEIKTEYVGLETNKTGLCEDGFEYECSAQTSLKRKVKTIRKGLKDNIITNNKEQLIPAVYDCGLCAEKLEKDKLSEHIKNHERSSSCGICSIQIDNRETMLYHRISHLRKPNLMCHICLSFFQLPITLEYHYNVKHFGKIEDAAKCRECNINYNTLKSLKQHRQTVHNDRGKTYKCDECSECFRNDNILRYHKNKYHNERNETKNKTWRCNECDYTSKAYCSFRKHRLRAHTPSMVCCKFCEALFKDDSGLQRHKCKYSAPAVCPVCGVVIKVPIQMKRHLASHSDERKYKCDRCDVAYKSRDAFRVHMNKHEGIRAHKCEYCPAAFWGHPALIKHRRLHTGEKPYVCKACSKGFISNHNLKVHMKVHGVHNLIKKKGAGEDLVQQSTRCSPVDLPDSV